MTTVVLLPGMDGSGTLFGDFIEALGTRTIIVSYPPDRPLDYESLQAFVKALLPVGEPYILLGESFSGPIAINLAAAAPASLQAVILVCTFATLRRRRAPRVFRSLFALLPFWKLPVSFGAAALLGRFDSAAVQTKLSAAIRGVAPAVWRIRLRSILDVDVTSQLQRIRIPILYLRASEDRVVPAAAAELISRSNSCVSVVEVEGPHALLQTNPTACASAVRAFANQSGIAL